MHPLMKLAPSLPALFLYTIKKLPTQPASFYTPSRNYNFVIKDFTFSALLSLLLSLCHRVAVLSHSIAGSTWENRKKSWWTRLTLRMGSGWWRVARSGSGAKAPPLAARPSTVKKLAQFQTAVSIWQFPYPRKHPGSYCTSKKPLYIYTDIKYCWRRRWQRVRFVSGLAQGPHVPILRLISHWSFYPQETVVLFFPRVSGSFIPLPRLPPKRHVSTKDNPGLGKVNFR